MKKLFLSILVGLSLVIISCSKSDSVVEPEPTVELEDERNDFVWKALNYWYFFQENVTDLDDSKDDDIDAYYTYLNNYKGTDFEGPNNLFEDLKYDQLDDFSWFIPDVDEQLNQFRGVSFSYGMEMPRTVFRVDPDDSNNNDRYIYITYVVLGSPADIAGFKRGDLIYKVDGQILNASNFTLLNDVIFPKDEGSATIGVGKLENNAISPRLEVTINAVEVSENPVHHKSIIQEGGKKIGYLVYNSFNYIYHTELNEAFEFFKTNGVDELILDLRYNRGGRILTSAFLASMLEGNISEGSTFARTKYNSKRDADNGLNYPFFNTLFVYDKTTGEYIEGADESINRLTNLNKLYIITSNSTASASEMIINGLNPSMSVTLVGLKTVGKNEGSLTLVDAPATTEREIYTNVDGRTSSHTIGIQPIVLQVFNSLGQSDYTDGFEPNPENIIDELDYSDNILPFGDTNEALLRKTLDLISNSASKSALKKSTNLRVPSAKLKEQKQAYEMYVLPGEEQFLKK